MRIVVIAGIPLVAAATAILFRHIGVRIVSVATILLTAVAMLGGLIAPARVAAELILPAPQGAEWWQGARDATDVVQSSILPLVATLSALALIAVIPRRRAVATNGH